eukprot:TRINITY_DN12308_c2_g5_i9.p1 TRINITY_DN12308_c2_g5~~TRINITY_DN12308_c2_g5_i9.p1  ORF type:complete len:140 (+),score=18.41 TRINITY_DN12308_c2_g5_i9:223-642(+)
MWRSLPFGGRADQSAALDPSSPVMVPLDPSIDDSTVSELSPHHKMQVSVVRDLVQNYFEVVRKRVRDSVPKTVMTFMVNQLQEDLHSELVKTLYQPNMIESLLEEEPGLVEEVRRRQVQNVYVVMHRDVRYGKHYVTLG